MAAVLRVGALGAMFAMLLAAGNLLPVAASSTVPPHGGSTIVQPVQLAGGVKAKVVSTTTSIADTRNVQTTGWVEFFNSGAHALKVTISFYHSVKGQRAFEPGTELVSVGAHARTNVPVDIQVDSLPPGVYEFGVMAKPTSNVTVESASETVLGLPAPGTNGYLANNFKTRTTTLALGPTPMTVLQTSVDFSAAGARSGSSNVAAAQVNALAHGWVNVVGGSRKTTVTLDYYMDDALMGSVSQIVGPDQPISIPFGLVCNAIPATGSHTFSIKVHASFTGPVTRSGFVSVVGLPTDGSMPNSSKLGDGSVHPLGTKPQQFLTTTLTTSVVSDVWMGGWLGLQNTTDKPIAVTVQAAMGGEAEGPALTVTVPKHGFVNIPFGLVCDAEPANPSMTLDVMLNAASGGVNFNGDGVLEDWALASIT